MHDVVCDWMVVIAVAMSFDATAQPTRKPVMPHVFATPLTTMTLLASVLFAVKS